MSGLIYTSTDLAVSAKPQIASSLRDLLASNKYLFYVGSSTGYLSDSGTATASTDTTHVYDTGGGWTTDEWIGARVTVYVGSTAVVRGTSIVTTNSATVLTMNPAITGCAALDLYTVEFAVNPTLGNNFQMEWDGTKIVVHNDYPVYSSVDADYYFITVIAPGTDHNIAVGSLGVGATPYSHIFLVHNAEGAHKGTVEIVTAATTTKPATIGVEYLYMGWVYYTTAGAVVVKNIGRLIDNSFLSVPATAIDFTDEGLDEKTSVYATNQLRYIGFIGPGFVKTITEVGLFIKDDAAYPHMFAYSKVPSHNLLTSENLRLLWNITI